MKSLKAALFFFTFIFNGAIYSDEGMWLLNDPPRKQLKEKYNFEITADWLERAQLAAVRFNNGGSGSFISADGLIITNHHVGADCLEKLNQSSANYYRDGFAARSFEEELKCPDLELNILQSIEDVTARVNSAVQTGMTNEDAFASRRKAMAEIEKESLDKTGLRSDVIRLYQGGLYHLYRYKKYTDVRVVFSPEQGIAFFGGDTDNFEFPRFNMDICFFRAYENGKPAKPERYLKWSRTGPGDGELVFVVGNPGSTNRHETAASLKFKRDVIIPYKLGRQRFREALIRQFIENGEEFERMAGDKLHDAANHRKSLAGQYEALLTPSILETKMKKEEALRKGMNPEPFSRIEAAVEEQRKFIIEFYLFESGEAFDSDLFRIARHLVRLAAETKKPGTERLREYRDSNLESLRHQLFSPAPISAVLQKTLLAGSFSFAAENAGADHPLMIQILNGLSPSARADQLVSGTKLFDPAIRKQIAEGGWSAIEQSKDTMIQLALKVDPAARKLRKQYETHVDEVEQQAYAQIANARFQLHGTSEAPDATFTLRLSYGIVKGYPVGSDKIPYATTINGLFDRSESHHNKYPFELPESWIKSRAKLNGDTPLNFVSTADTIGGSSGSPVINRNGEFVGINFDRNRFGLVRNFLYDEAQARHIAVHSGGILEALRVVYKNDRLVDEILNAKNGRQ